MHYDWIGNARAAYSLDLWELADQRIMTLEPIIAERLYNNQMEKKMQNEMETREYYNFIHQQYFEFSLMERIPLRHIRTRPLTKRSIISIYLKPPRCRVMAFCWATAWPTSSVQVTLNPEPYWTLSEDLSTLSGQADFILGYYRKHTIGFRL